jgi:V/A-type H+/Na+-transporting ATPase subunit F
MELAVIGGVDFTLGFRLAGIRDIVGAEAAEEYEERLQKLLGSPDLGVIVVLDEDLRKIKPSLRAKALDSIRPVVVAIGHTDVSGLRERVRRAMGVDLYAGPGKAMETERHND